MKREASAMEAFFGLLTVGAARARRTGLAVTATTGALLLVLGTAASDGRAAPLTPTAAAADPGNAAKVVKLTREIKALEKEYGGNLEQLRDTRQDAARSLAQVRTLGADLGEAQGEVARMAASQYMNNGVDPSIQILNAADPRKALDGATLAAQIGEARAARVRQIQNLRDRQERARRESEAKIKKLEADIKEISRQRERVKKLLRRYKPESPMIGTGGMTARMVKVRNEIEAEFGPFPVIGCTRPGDPLDHGTGRACDFMESTGGSMPSAARTAHGDQVAAYAIKHAGRLGIKYIIWRQRIYDMRSPGWRMMSDRGSVTQNHYDHNHISVF
ncbi:DUF4200 domain-containing protein [Spirillospora sp. NPDC047279]|uniref:DUF4200 domain-containing protein n=1 Tax=Spirillospora sp. NPDC047279 TaxID=3155478 RepID=UPI00340BFD16